MKEIILIKCGEIALKGLNRSGFEDRLVKNCKRRLEDLGKFKCWKAQSTIYIEPQEEDIDLDFGKLFDDDDDMGLTPVAPLFEEENVADTLDGYSVENPDEDDLFGSDYDEDDDSGFYTEFGAGNDDDLI